MFARVKQFVEVQAQLGYRWIHVHASTPCSSGSPLKHFGTGGLSEADVAWEGIMKAVPKYLTLGIRGHLNSQGIITFGREMKPSMF